MLGHLKFWFTRIGLTLREASDIVERCKKLTPREWQVLELHGKCLRYQDIAERLNVSIKTLDTHRSRLNDKLGTNSPGLVRAWAVWCMSGELIPKS